jgi:hypothetical protein
MYKSKWVAVALVALCSGAVAHAGRIPAGAVYVVMKSGRSSVSVTKPKGFDAFVTRLGGDPGRATSVGELRKLAGFAVPADRALAKKLISNLAAKMHNDRAAKKEAFDSRRVPWQHIDFAK